MLVMVMLMAVLMAMMITMLMLMMMLVMMPMTMLMMRMLMHMKKLMMIVGFPVLFTCHRTCSSRLVFAVTCLHIQRASSFVLQTRHDCGALKINCFN